MIDFLKRLYLRPYFPLEARTANIFPEPKLIKAIFLDNIYRSTTENLEDLCVFRESGQNSFAQMEIVSSLQDLKLLQLVFNSSKSEPLSEQHLEYTNSSDPFTKSESGTLVLPVFQCVTLETLWFFWARVLEARAKRSFCGCVFNVYRFADFVTPSKKFSENVKNLTAHGN